MNFQIFDPQAHFGGTLDIRRISDFERHEKIGRDRASNSDKDTTRHRNRPLSSSKQSSMLGESIQSTKNAPTYLVRDLDTDAANLHEYEGHTLVHSRFVYLYRSNLRQIIRVHNLFDEDYAERADFNAFGGDRYFPGLPRQIYISLEYSF